jgi:hypothetical protein
MHATTGLACAAAVTAAMFCTLAPAAAEPVAERPATIKVAVRRLTESQYRHAIADVFGPQVKVEARFEPEKREEGLLAIGSSQLSLTSAGLEQYFALAGAISKQVLSSEQRAAAVPCQPAKIEQPDEPCARRFVADYGERLFRRPMTEPEVRSRIDIAAAGSAQLHDFYGGLELALTSLLVAPEFLFRVETAEPDPEHPGQYRLDAYTKASRLSFLFWDTAPDPELLAAARSGALHTQAGLRNQLTRLASSPRYEQGARALFADVLQLDGFDNLIKDPAIYPKFSQAVADSAREQTLRTTIDLLIKQQRDYRDLFSSNETYVNRYLASVYQVPFISANEWAPYKFPDSSERAGILTQASFLSLFAHPGTSSPTRRGIKIHEIFMCEMTPDPPADVDFSKVKDSKSGTVRGRLLDHMQNTGCTACHRRSDPPGLALEHFDGMGQLRTAENGVPIDVSAELNGKKFVGARGLADLLREDPRVPACMVRDVFAYGVGRKTDDRDEDYLAGQAQQFAANGYRVPDLMMQVAATPEFFKAAIPRGAKPAAAATTAQDR